ncbi:kynureninase [Jannaschia sp. LMIT008]|uniref:kynureninase n=1 Tax=Jannaschia maritima TaxID=3032585 RepID=UPI0028121AFA|nr:kynureninase [Jannaschia sp. LMIT008]
MDRIEGAGMDWDATRAAFALPEGVIYLDGNSLGPLPRGARDAVARTLDDWQARLIGGWTGAGWMDAPDSQGDRIARLIGAPEGSVTVGDTLTLKVHQMLAAALRMRPDRRVVLSDSGNFPTDLYIAQGLLDTLGRGHELRVVPPEGVTDALDGDVAAMMLTHVDYRTGRMHNMATLTARAHDVGALAIWDLAHSAGAVPVDVTGAGADFAAGCTYKYLNAGPGAPAFVHVRPDLIDAVEPALSGWLGHAAPFAFEPAYRPASGIGRMRIGTPPVLQMAALSAALDVWDGVSMDAVRARSVALSERLIAGVEASCPALTLASPRDAASRGSQVSFRHPEGYSIMQVLIARGVIGDFRAPDILRFGVTPLYLSEREIDAAVDHLAAVMAGREWDDPRHRVRRAVT